jgi:DNA-binding MarR family transcriptional regulator
MTAGRKSKPLTDADYRALAEFRHQLRQFQSFSEDAARMAGLQPRHHQALLAIKGFESLTVGDLAERLRIKAHSAAELVNRLVAARLVRRRADTVDRRKVFLTLTPTAEHRLEKLTIAHRDELQRLASLWRPLFKALEKGAARRASPAPRKPRPGR